MKPPIDTSASRIGNLQSTIFLAPYRTRLRRARVVREKAVYTVYVLRSLKDGRHYTGSTSDLARRLKEHNDGKTESTKRRRPFEVIYTEEYGTRVEAETREKFLKSGKGREELKKLFTGAVPKW
jgi:putative endonuclease